MLWWDPQAAVMVKSQIISWLVKAVICPTGQTTKFKASNPSMPSHPPPHTHNLLPLFYFTFFSK